MEADAERARSWFHIPLPRPDAALRLVCLSHAGGGANAFRPWARLLGPEVELVAVRLPGRERRIRERPLSAWPGLLRELTAALALAVRPPYALFGHSLGGMIAYELSCLPAPAAPPVRLVLAGCRAPDVPNQLPRLGGLPDDAFARELLRIDGTPREVLENPGLLRMFLPMLRADFVLAESWPPEPPRPVPVPLTAVAAHEDRVAPPWAVDRWSAYTAEGLARYTTEGGHFSLWSDPETILDILATELGA